MFTTAVVGSGTAEPPAKALISDTLGDTLRPGERPVRILVPVIGGSLTADVRAAIEWAWGQKTTIVGAVYDSSLKYTEVEEHFLDEGADETSDVDDVAYHIGRELADAMPDAALLVMLDNTELPELPELSRRLIDICFISGVPIYDICAAGIHVSPYDITGWENSEPEPEPEAKGEEVATVAETEPPALAPALTLPEETAVALRQERSGWVKVEKVAATHINAIDDRLKGGQPAKKPGHNGILISYDGGKTKHPRGRGKAPKGSIEYDAKTLKEIRRN